MTEEDKIPAAPDAKVGSDDDSNDDFQWKIDRNHNSILFLNKFQLTK